MHGEQNDSKQVYVTSPFRDPQPHSPTFLKKVKIFTSVEALRFLLFVFKIFFLQIVCLAE